MNNFDTPEKVASIDNAIEFLLKENDIDWKNKRLYSWHWTDGEDVVPGIKIRNHSDILKFYNVKDIGIKLMSSNIRVPGLIDDKKLSDYIRPTLVKLRYDHLPNVAENNDFVLNLNVRLYTGTAPGNFVISSVQPDSRISEEHGLRSEVGKWYTLH